jgi:hypothetical protein
MISYQPSTTPLRPDPHGQAALLLCEALLHLLVEQNVLEKNDVCSTIEGVEEVKLEFADKEPLEAVKASLDLLRSIRESFVIK